MTRRTFGVAVLTGWLSVLGLHVRREYFAPESARLEEGARSLAPGSHFYIVRMGGTAIGRGSTRLDTVAGGRFRIDDDLILDVPALDTVQRATAQTSVTLDPRLRLAEFRFTLVSEIGRFTARGEVQRDSSLNVEVYSGAGRERTSVAGAGDLLLDVAVPLRAAAAGNLEVGRSFRARVFDPSSMAEQESEYRVVEMDTMIVPDSVGREGGRWVATGWDTVAVWRIEQSMAGVAVTTWVDNDGMVVRAESPLGFAIERTAYELSVQEWTEAQSDTRRAAGYGAIIERTAISAGAALAAAAGGAELRVRLLGVDLDGFDLDGGAQTLRGDTLVIRRGGIPLAGGYELPYAGDEGVEAELASTPLIQAGDPRIVAKAAEVLGGTTDPVDAALRLNDWVHAALAKRVTPSVPSAVQVLEALRGDCNEHTVLYVALARAVGLPTRTAAGLVHIDGRFYYHAWPEVWLAGQWLALDPTLGQFPADASHLRFTVGGLARQLELVRLIGRLRLEVP